MRELGTPNDHDDWGTCAMPALTRGELRLLFMREGKLAGSAWHTAWEDPPSVVMEHVAALLKETASSMAAWDRDAVELVESTYFAAARKARASNPTEEAMGLLHPDALRQRIAGLRSASNALAGQRELQRGLLSEAALLLRDRLVSFPESSVTFGDLGVLFREIGRLSGPLWTSGTASDFPTLPDFAVSVLKATLSERMKPERVFDSGSSQFVFLGYEAKEGELRQILLEAISQERTAYFADFPMNVPLPFDPAKRGNEEERRVAARASVIQRANDAVDQLVTPIHAAHSSHLEQKIAALVAETERVERERREARAQIGFARPERQPYGVSPRGAELWVTDAMRWLGVHDAEVTQQSNDGGVDVFTADFAVSVKHYAGAVPVEEIREIFGVAITLNKTPVLWTSGTLTRSAEDFADLAPVAVINYDVHSATFQGVNATGREMLIHWGSS
jgi:hypothetical protein